MSSTIPYTHWAYFPDRTSAEECARELADYVTRISEPDPEVTSQWRLLAARDVEVAGLEQRHREVEAIVTQHGGEYDGGEATYESGHPVADPAIVQRDED
ncbi:ribonuclease E inhibitor RraB [Streptomyces anthocyanicus]|uniref:ribonuclease E inhibitor RraB n=1 Tax=Streptomyces anthocyanicus TaxID=68174 RepID=UPI00380E834F